MRSFHKRYDYLVHKLEKYISLQGKVVADCGCGVGDGTAHFAKAGCKTIGMDISKKRIKSALIEFPQLDFRVRSILNTCLSDDSIDIFICSETLEHLTRTQSLKAAKEISRVCRPVAYVCVTVPENKKVCLKKKGHKQYLSREVLIDHFEEWEVVSSTVFYKNPVNKRGNRIVIFRTVD